MVHFLSIVSYLISVVVKHGSYSGTFPVDGRPRRADLFALPDFPERDFQERDFHTKRDVPRSQFDAVLGSQKSAKQCILENHEVH